MAKISTYAVDNSISADDMVIGTDAEDSNITKNYTVGGLSSYIVTNINFTPLDFTSAQAGSNVNLNLLDNVSTLGTVGLVAGTNITLTDDGSDNITIAGANLIGGTNITIVDDGLGNLTINGGVYGYKTELLMFAQSFNDQLPSGLDSTLQVEFGAAQGTVADPVMVDNAGNITFNQAGEYLFNGFANFERQGSSGGVTVTAFRALINGVQQGAAKMVELDTVGIAIPYEVTIPIKASANDVLTWEIIRDSSGVDAGGLYDHLLLGPWGARVPSASFTVYKVTTEVV